MSTPDSIPIGNDGWSFRLIQGDVTFFYRGLLRSAIEIPANVVTVMALEILALRERESLHIDIGAAQAETIKSHEAYIKKLDGSRLHMDSMLVRLKEWQHSTQACKLTDDSAESMLQFVLQGQYVPINRGVIAELEDVREFKAAQARERQHAENDAVTLGMGFIVHGVHVSPNNVIVLGGVENVDKMRAATAEAREALAEFKQALDATSNAEADTMRIDWLDTHCVFEVAGQRRWIIDVDSGIHNVRLALDSKGALGS